MIQSETLPKTLTLHQVVQLLGRAPYEVRALVTTRRLQSSSYEELPTEAVGKYLVEECQLTREEAEGLICSTIYPHGHA